MHQWPWILQWIKGIVILLFVYPACCRSIEVPVTPSPNGKVTVVDLSEDHSLQLLQHWMDQAMSGLMAAMATKKLDGLSEKKKDNHEQCAKGANTVQEHAKCLVKLMDDEGKTRKMRMVKEGAKNIVFKKDVDIKEYPKKRKIKRKRTRREKKDGILHRRKRKRHENDTGSTVFTTPPTRTTMATIEMDKDDDNDWVGSFKLRAKREVVVRDSYTLSDARESPFAVIARQLTKTIKTIKNKNNESKSWKTIVSEISDISRQLKAKKQMKHLFAKRFAVVQEKAAKGDIDPRRPLAMKDYDNIDEDDPKALLEEAKKMEKKLPEGDRILREPLNLIREAARIGMMIGGQNVSNFDEKTLKLFSPRMMSVIPEEENKNEFNFLSPSLFSLHNDGKGIEKATSLVNGFGLVKNIDHEEWLNFVMEAAGVNDAVETLKDRKLRKITSSHYDEDEFKTESGQPLYFTKENVTELYGEKETKKMDVFERLHETYTTRQMDEIKERGFSIMTNDQLNIMYGYDSPYHDKERLQTLSSLNSTQVPGMIEENIRAVAEMKSFNIQRKDVILTPVILTPLISQTALLSQPIILSPLVFSPSILTPAIFGPVILGPWVFIPVILSPRVFSPLILNPLIFSPIVLSPLLFHPLILSPGIFNPIVLSPLVLSPFILSPQVFTPLILSPFVLNPLILNPMVGSPLILSPFVLSPIILSPQLLFAVVLSPYALSPIIQSELNGAQVVLSPSWLS